ncbi:16S rRNA (uracil(1498)-N(3))-methyltransferase [Eionea flava]
MNLLLLFENDFISENIARISGRRLDHIQSVHKAKAGDHLQVGVVNSCVSRATITQIETAFVELLLEPTQATSPPPPLPLTLIIALPRPKMIKRILQICATMGVKDIIFLNSFRVEKSYWQSPLLSKEKITEQLVLGLEQGKDTVLPRVTLEKRFKPFVEDHLPSYCSDSLALVAHPYSDNTCPQKVEQQTTLVIGPEGGFIPYEIEKLEAAGCQGVTLGQRILRVETAIPVLLGKLF